MPDEMQQILCALVREHGAAALLADANWCRGLLNEHGITQHLLQDERLTERLREVNLLVSAVEAGVAAELHAETSWPPLRGAADAPGGAPVRAMRPRRR